MIDCKYTPEAFIQKQNSAEVLYSYFVLYTAQYGKNAVYCFVEGYDMPYYISIVRNIYRGKTPVGISCKGKSNVIAVNKYIESIDIDKNRKYTKRYFVDRDFDNNDQLSDTIFVTDGYAIENYYLSDTCVSNILEIELKISQVQYPDQYSRCMTLFRQEHNKFIKGTLLLNAWYYCLYHNANWNRSNVSLNEKFPKEWLKWNIGNITFHYTLTDIQAKFDKAPILDIKSIERQMNEFTKLGASYLRGKYEIQFLYEFLKFIRDEPKNHRYYSVATCSLPFHLSTMISTFAQYADVSEKLYNYIKTGKRK